MRKSILMITFFMSTYYLTAQTEERDLFSTAIDNTNRPSVQTEEKYLISVGVNAIVNDVRSEGSYFNLNRLDRLDVQNPFFFGMERKLSRGFSLEALVSINKLELLNEVSQQEEFGYFGVDINGKLYFDNLFAKRHRNRWDLYMAGGFGFYDLNDDIAFTYNVGGGLQLWFTETVGVGCKGMGKLGIRPMNELVNNYYQFHFGIMYRI
ncbi:hypothetical protein L0P88_15350 [Muricauda sp. SCSIO 64092]|uniref:hypothetical protein n=1 Tax=Allomuricauda sp. SCSIO 64092 TaxID=2908842 RepID=UPI001FF29CC3|nr:hypothetical protein [Muricauda sp. SCSIO 64092]UOY05321.1 hypothetical protein L0P88_15350 [Muricauda sp. SCSIO 64092]